MRVSRLIDMFKNRMQREALYCTAEYWDSKAVEHQGDSVSMWPNNHLNRHYQKEQFDLVQKLLPDVEGRAILDIGCGTGRNSRYFASRGAMVMGIDFSGRAIDIARELSKGSNPAYRQQSIFDLSEKEGYDIAVSWGTVAIACKNKSELLQALRNIRQALKPGGTLLLCEPVHVGFLHRVLDMSLKDFLAVMREAGFESLKVENLHFWPMRIALAYVGWPAFLTSAGYWLGQGVMKMVRNQAWGDYKTILARRV